MIEYDTHAPSPEALYIGRETAFLGILKDYRIGKRTFRNILDAYLIIWECGFNFDEIKLAYENEIDEKIDVEEANYFLNGKKDDSFVIAKEKYNSLHIHNPLRQKFAQRI